MFEFDAMLFIKENRILSKNFKARQMLPFKTVVIKAIL